MIVYRQVTEFMDPNIWGKLPVEIMCKICNYDVWRKRDKLCKKLEKIDYDYDKALDLIDSEKTSINERLTELEEQEEDLCTTCDDEKRPFEQQIHKYNTVLGNGRYDTKRYPFYLNKRYKKNTRLDRELYINKHHHL